MKKDSHNEICRRVAEIRREVAGARGKSSFAKQLGLSPSTYDYYESTRVPPVEVLVKIVEISGVDLHWLLSGTPGGGAMLQADNPAVARAVQMLSKSPDYAKPLAAFLDLLSETMKFPQKENLPASSGMAGEDVSSVSREDSLAEGSPQPRENADAKRLPAELPDADKRAESWIPVLGRSAAGIAQFWSDADETDGIATLENLIQQRFGNRDADVRRIEGMAVSPDGAEQSVSVVTLTEPDGGNVSQFIASADLKKRFPNAFALQIDGESMSPEINHGNFVIASPSHSAVDGQPAVIQLEKQIGVTCKLYRRTSAEVHLIPINEKFTPTAVPAGMIVWAFRILAVVRG